MIENTAYDLDAVSATVDITALSIYLDGTVGTNYSVYVMDGEYITTDEEGTVLSMLGDVLGEDESGVNNAGWRRHGVGYVYENAMNYEGMAVLNLDVPISITLGSLKSIYIKLNTIDLCGMENYDDGKALTVEGVDESVKSEEGFDLLKIHVGRAVSLLTMSSYL